MKETVINLAKAHIGESQARNRYTYYASTAKAEGFEQIAAIFEETALQEKTHAKWNLRMLNELTADEGGGDEAIQVESEVPHTLGTTAENLKAAIAGENHEYTSMYPEFADKAEEEGYPKVAARLRCIAKAEQHHEERYLKLLKLVESGTFFKRQQPQIWICRECGFMHEGLEAPVVCPACDHPQAFYQVKSEDY